MFINECTECYTNFFLYPDNYDPGASSQIGSCEIGCSNGYFIENVTLCLPAIPNCKQTRAKNLLQCSECEDFYYKVERYPMQLHDQCLQLVNCEIINQDNPRKCDKCLPAYFKLAGVYSLDIDLCINPIPHCQVYGYTQYECLECETGYQVRTNASTDECHQPIPNCVFLNPEESACLACETGYYLNTSTNQCIRAIDNCQVYGADAFTCLRCVEKFYLNASSYPNTCTQPINNCSLYGSSPLKCVQCDEQFIRIDNQQNASSLVPDSCVQSTQPI